MRSLTPAEARVIAELLAESPGAEAERIRRSGVPRTTFQTVRRRLFVSGWLKERYIPSAGAVGAGAITFRLAQPFAERRAELVRRWRDDPSVVVLWASPDSVFSVAYDRSNTGSAPTPSSLGPAPSDAGGLRRSWTVLAAPDPSGVPVYFDYEGAWARRAGAPAPTSYPQPFPVESTGAPTARSRDLADLLARPFPTVPWESLEIRLGAGALPRRQRRLVEHGWVAHRTFPALAEIPPYQGARDERVVFVTGRLRDDSTFDRLLAGLYQESRVSPFLAVQGQGRVLLGTLSPAPTGTPSNVRPVLSTLEGALREIEVVREPLETLFPVLDHRYDRLVPE